MGIDHERRADIFHSCRFWTLNQGARILLDDLMATNEPTLSTEQLYILRTIRDVFEERGAWPALQYVSYRLFNEHAGDLMAELKSLAPRLVMVYGNPGNPQPGDALHLTYRGLKLAGGQERLEKVLSLLRWLAERQLRFEPSSPTEAEYPQVTADDADPHFRWTRDDSMRTYALLEDLWGWMQGGGLGTYEGQPRWSASLAPEIRQFQNLESVDQLIEMGADLLEGPTRPWE